LSFSFLISSFLTFLLKIYRINRILRQGPYGSLFKALGLGFKKLDSSPAYGGIMKDYWSFLRANYFSTSLLTMIRKIDILAAGYFFNREIVGLLKLARSLTKNIQEFAGILGKPLYQELNELLAQGRKHKILPYLKKHLPLFLSVLAIFLVIVSFFSEPFIKIIYGIDFVSATYYFKLYLILVFVVLGNFWNLPLLLALKAWNYRLKVLFVTVLLSIGGVVLLSSVWGVVGIIIAVILSRLYMFVAFFYYILKMLKSQTQINYKEPEKNG